MKHIAILSNSKAAIKALSFCRIKSRQVLEVRNNLGLLGKNNTLIIMLIPAYIDIEGNMREDILTCRRTQSKKENGMRTHTRPAPIVVLFRLLQHNAVYNTEN